MKPRLSGLFGAGRGPLARAAPPVRLITGILLVAAALLTPLTGPGAVVLPVLAVLTIVAAGLPARHAFAFAGLALLLYVPLVTLLALPTLRAMSGDLLAAAGAGGEAMNTWLAGVVREPAIRRIGGIVLRGTALLLVTVATISTIGPRDVHVAIGGLPLPRDVRLVLLQIVQQTGMLLNETRRVRDAVAVRGGARGRGGVLLAALPTAWLIRVTERAERVADSMEVRGYLKTGFGERRIDWRPADAVAVVAGVTAIIVAVTLRSVGA